MYNDTIICLLNLKKLHSVFSDILNVVMYLCVLVLNITSVPLFWFVAVIHNTKWSLLMILQYHTYCTVYLGKTSNPRCHFFDCTVTSNGQSSIFYIKSLHCFLWFNMEYFSCFKTTFGRFLDDSDITELLSDCKTNCWADFIPLLLTCCLAFEYILFILCTYN